MDGGVPVAVAPVKRSDRRGVRELPVTPECSQIEKQIDLARAELDRCSTASDCRWLDLCIFVNSRSDASRIVRLFEERRERRCAYIAETCDPGSFICHDGRCQAGVAAERFEEHATPSSAEMEQAEEEHARVQNRILLQGLRRFAKDDSHKRCDDPELLARCCGARD